MTPAARNTGVYEMFWTTYPVVILASIPPIAPPMPENPVAEPVSPGLKRSVGSV